MPTSRPITRSRTRTQASISLSDQYDVSSSDTSDDDNNSDLQEYFEEKEKEDGFLNDQGNRTESENMRGKSVDEGRMKSSISISFKKTCKVCKGTDHQAGFRGATYFDCPRKPCFLCKLPGHTTITCPQRMPLENALSAASPWRTSKNIRTCLDYVFKRQLRPNIPTIKPAFCIPNQVDRVLIRFHSRRITCLEFHPSKNGVLLSGDKKGQLGIWDYTKLCEKTIYESVHSCILNNIKFITKNDGTIYTSSSDGSVSCTDLETGMSSRLMDLNPDGWNGPANWRMIYGLDCNQEKGLLLAADNLGSLYMFDPRSNKMLTEPLLIHKRGSKVVGLHCNPFQSDILLSCGNDHFARIWDLRQLGTGKSSSLCNLQHDRVVNSAYFSPRTGSKIVTTSQDNRIRVWDCIFRDMERPAREIVHSHDFNRYLTPFRAEWDPKDPSESLIVIGRYITENYDGLALHPIDFIDTATGQLVAEVIEPDMPTISSVNKLHPVENLMASGSSRSIFIWKPQKQQNLKKQKQVDIGSDVNEEKTENKKKFIKLRKK
ncbi:putative DNA damage-binding protein [Zostera marina]|uniref:Putative DNA damage-binding protein n=1 Tax=Zostera marina TaxID=29655 RepID=A0A0K9NVW1_ZOSMR|nr:putative DNA damage-binding protein [Zostera marina]